MLMATLDVNVVPLTPSEHQIQLRRAVIASTVGTAIEWYDFFLYSTVTGLVFAKLFFSAFGPLGRDTRGLRHLCRRLRGATDRCCHFRALRRPHRPQVDADRDAALDGIGYFRSRAGPDL